MSEFNIRYFTKLIFEKYAREFGERKALALISSLSESAFLNQTLQLWDFQDFVPTYKDIQKVVGAINWFVISRRESTAVGMLIALSKWDEQVNKSNRLVSTGTVLQIAYDILDSLKVYLNEANAWKVHAKNLLTKHVASSSVKQTPKLTFLEKVYSASKISNIKSLEYKLQSNEEVIRRRFSATELIVATDRGRKIWGGIFDEFPSEIISLIKKACISSFPDLEMAYLKFNIMDQNSIEDDTLLLTLGVFEEGSFDEEMGWNVLYKIYYMVTEHGLVFESEDDEWTVYLGIDKEDWKFI